MKRTFLTIAAAIGLLLGAQTVVSSCGSKDQPEEVKPDPENPDPDKPDPGQPETYNGIKTAADLVAFADSVNAGASIERFKVDGAVTLLADIDMASVTKWVPVGSTSVNNETSSCSYSGNVFKGEFNGADHCIYNFKMLATVPSAGSYGLFSVLDGANVHNLVMGKEGDNSIFSVSAAGVADAGVIAGTIINSTVQDCTNNIPVNVLGTSASSGRFTAGMIGYMFAKGGGTSNITKLVNNAPVTAEAGSNSQNGASGVMVGGIVGFCTGDADGSEVNFVESCENKGEIKAKVGRASGIAAALNTRTMMRYCVNRGNITCTFANARIGALTCIMGARTSMDESTNYGDVLTSDSQTTTGGMVALLNADDVVVTDGGNYGRVISANATYHGLLCANFSKFSKVSGCFAGGSCWTYSPDGKHVEHELTSSNLLSHLGAQASSNSAKITNIGSAMGNTGGGTDVEGKIVLKDASLKILFIGNSFTDDAVKYLPQVMAGCGVTDYTIAQLYYGGRTMPEYVSNFDTAEYTLYKAEGGAGTWTTHGSKVSIAQVAAGGRWDVVTFQEHTGNYLGWSWSDTEKKAIQGMFDKINATQSKTPKYYWILSQAYFNMSKIGSGSRSYMTWPLENTKAAQKQMYDVIVAQGRKVMSEFPFDGIISTGTMLQNLRTCAFNNNGWDQTRDGYHMEQGTARYGAACTVMETIVTPIKGKKLDGCTFRIPTFSNIEGSVSTPVTDITAPVVIQAARHAIAKPFEITDMSDVIIKGYNDSGSSEVLPLKGAGTEADPFIIATADDLKAIASNLSSGTSKYFKMTADIDMSSVTSWTPCNLKEDGTGIHFDGQGHTISNFKCGGNTYTSLFGVIHGSVRNLNFRNCSIDGTGVCAIVAASAGGANIQATIDNVHAVGCSVSQNNTTTAADCGGLFASAGNATITNCSYQGSLTNKKNANARSGGIVGAVSSTLTIERCWVDIQLNIANAPSGYGTGGIVGGPPANKTLTVRNCYSKGAFTGTGGYLGGIAGELASNGTVENCYSTMTIVGDYAMGGITGRIVNCVNPNSSGTWQNDIKNTVSGCIAWMSSITTNHAGGRVPTTGYSSGAVCAFTVYKNTLKNCWRKPGMTFNVYSDAFSAYNAVFDQEDSSPSNPYVKQGSETYYMPYHGKAAAAGESLSDVARRIGWSETIWDLSGSEPSLR